MKIKRPVKLLLIALILGIITAYSNINIFIKIILIAISFFMIKKIFDDNKIKLNMCIFLIIIFILGAYRLNISKNSFEDVNRYINNNKINSFTGKISNIGSSTNSTYYDLVDVKISDKKVEKVRVYFDKEKFDEYKIGNIVKVEAKIYPIEPPMNYGEFNSENYYRSLNINFTSYMKNIYLEDGREDKLKQTVYNIKQKIKVNIFKIFDEDDAGVVLMMLTGDKSKISQSIKKLFSDNGISHILAISGLHLSILGLMLFELLRKKFSIKISAFIVSIFIFLYGIMINASATSLRAIIMLYIRFLSLALGRSYDSKNTLYVLCFLSLIINPYLLFNAGFLFSYVAVFSLNLDYVIYDEEKEEREIVKYNNKILYKVDIDTKEKINIYNKKYKVIKVPNIIILSLFIFPITIYNYFDYPTYSILLNLIVIPLMTIVLLFSIFGILFSFINIYFAKIIVLVVHYILYFYKFLCNLFIKIPYSTINFGKPSLYQVLIFYAVLFIIYIYSKKKVVNNNEIKYDELNSVKYKLIVKKCINIIIAVFFIIVINYIQFKPDFKMSFLYVGQGDGIIIDNKDTIISIDGGSTSNSSLNKYILTPNLKSRKINKINHAFLSHSDSDHVNGIIDMINEDDVNVEKIYLPIFAKDNIKYKKIIDLSSDNNIEVIYLKSGEEVIIDDIKIYVLNPILNNSLQKNDVNEQSLAFILDYNGIKTMFTGDIGKATEESILKMNKDNLDVDILKVAHHGSRGSSDERFINEVNPEISIISCGINNQYNHPHKETINTLNQINTKIYNTNKNGEIDIIFDKKMKIKTFIN